MVFDKEFKEALLNLPTAEKDKLLLRLLKKDVALVDKLHFELLSDLSVDDARAEIEEEISKKITELNNNDFKPGWFMMELRYLSGDITYHVKKTKDKQGEVSLNLLLLNEFLTHNEKHITKASTKKYYNLIIYIIAKAFRILINVKALHEDLLLEFSPQLIELGAKFSSNHHLMQLSIYNGFDVNWLLQQTEIPEDIKEIHKAIRAQGFLK